MLELLAPAGSMEAVAAAVQNGTDAVYLGYGDFNARRNAKNFSEEEFAAAVSYCHLRGAKVYLTLNTLLTDRELPAAADLARRAAELGAELVPFSPLADEKLPDGVQGLYLGGGYPELYAARLEENHTLRRQIREAVHTGMPCIAECGGFMYLTQGIAGRAMVGALPGDCFDTGKLTRFGYITATAREDNLLCRAGEQVPMHEFHH